MNISGGTVFQSEGMACGKARRWERAQWALGMARRPERLEPGM